MDDIALDHIRKMEDLAMEAKQLLLLKNKLLQEYESALSSYQHKRLSYKQYTQRVTELFGTKSKKEWLDEQHRLLHELYRKIDFYNRQVFFRVYSEGMVQGSVPISKKAPIAQAAPKPQLQESPAIPKAVAAEGFEALFEELESQ